jgi:4-amino-4-deoxy-L-arabinose transferase-like glycosyltransferase
VSAVGATRPAFALERSWPVRRDRVALGGVLAVALALRAVALAGTPLNPFYDAAVRTMGGSWHALLTGALDPSGQVAIDKPPVDLWLQVASTKVFGFGAVGLLLPGVVCGVASVALLYDLVGTLAGRRAGLVAAAALAVLPVDVITARSDTMDVAMSALVLAALAVTARGVRDGRASRVVVGGALVGLAFEVKLFEALLALVPLSVLWLARARAVPVRRRLGALAGAFAACAAVGVLWLVVLTVAVPAAHRPWAFGATNGSAWRATFVYDGWDRLAGGGHAAAPGVVHGSVPAAPGPLRLLSAQDGLGSRIGLELAAAWLVLMMVIVTRAWRPLDRTGRAGLLALASWLALGTVLFSAQAGFRPRYAEAFTAAIAAVLGIGAIRLAAVVSHRGRTLMAVALAAVLAASATTAIAAVSGHVEDSGTLGAMPAGRLQRLSAFLRDHQGTARYEAADVATTKAAALIAADGHAQLILDVDHGRPLVTPAALAAAVASGAVRYAVAGAACSTAAPDGCSPTARWIRAHGTDVSHAAGQPHAGLVYRLPAPTGAKGARHGR